MNVVRHDHMAVERDLRVNARYQLQRGQHFFAERRKDYGATFDPAEERPPLLQRERDE